MAFLTWLSSADLLSTILAEISLHNLFNPINISAPTVISKIVLIFILVIENKYDNTEYTLHVNSRNFWK